METVDYDNDDDDDDDDDDDEDDDDDDDEEFHVLTTSTSRIDRRSGLVIIWIDSAAIAFLGVGRFELLRLSVASELLV
ncbi:hypothetical protein PoB_000869100 [Plakobranchus ocellatus]|uniref:Uncharacterized protein n=1 Tax=Plakobranchus ocellatus TaxID=259542 RepID=A0AAV3YG83_9GAST|nr:hypothetical protein PoB_000869100 [Plakobranchus ocellatus]